VASRHKKSAAIGVKAPYPGFIEPALATTVDKVPRGDRWVHEIKFDGYRVQVHIRDGAVKVFTRRGNDWTKRFRKIADDAFEVNAGSAIIDGEVVAPAADGTTDFSVLQNELKGRSKKIVLVVFDLLYLDGYDLRKLPLVERKAHLKKIIEETDVQFSESFEIDGREMFEHACKTGLEGVVSKVRDSRYPTGRSRDWVKVACAQREMLPIAGFALDGNKWDGIYVGRRKGKELIYAGKVDRTASAPPSLSDFGKTYATMLSAKAQRRTACSRPCRRTNMFRREWISSQDGTTKKAISAKSAYLLRHSSVYFGSDARCSPKCRHSPARWPCLLGANC
jgi:bifunctional non-homologous end joining protein LigD